MRIVHPKAFMAWFLAAVAALALSGCGGSSSTAQEKGSTILIGHVATTAAAKAGDTRTLAVGDPIEVIVEEHPEIRATVGADGSFTLRGLPAGSFHLVFVQGGVTVGTLEFEEVAPNQQITITVQLDTTQATPEIVLVDEDRRGIGHAGIELEGLVDNVVTVSLTGDSTFVIAGRTVIARPGVTAIREGNTRKTVSDLLAGMRVHVKGTTIEGSTDILAYEIKIQNPNDTGGGTEDKITICHIPPGNPDKPHSISISPSAWPAHEAHGDHEGSC